MNINIYIQIYVNIFKIYTVHVCLYIHNKYTQYTRIDYVNKHFWILDVINHLTALLQENTLLVQYV